MGLFFFVREERGGGREAQYFMYCPVAKDVPVVIRCVGFAIQHTL